ncbi:MAG: hypothetical protein M1813_008174 [Trichoglossum hirsutum]|nr:MAG: hypothetical protein M1813_008174 [Trichoglossum hirsutum]
MTKKIPASYMLARTSNPPAPPSYAGRLPHRSEQQYQQSAYQQSAYQQSPYQQSAYQQSPYQQSAYQQSQYQQSQYQQSQQQQQQHYQQYQYQTQHQQPSSVQRYGSYQVSGSSTAYASSGSRVSPSQRSLAPLQPPTPMISRLPTPDLREAPPMFGDVGNYYGASSRRS